MWYFRELYIEEECHQDQYQSMLNEVMGFVKKNNFKVAAVRVLFRENQKLQFKGGHLEHYYIMKIDL